MSSIVYRWIALFIIGSCLIMHVNAETQDEKDGFGGDNQFIPPHNDTSHDEEGKNHDTEPYQNNGRGTHEANSQNYAAETNGTHGMAIDEFQQIVLDEHNKYRRQTCADDLQEDDDLHEKAIKRAHDLANGFESSLSNDYNENVFELDTGDPSTITGEMIVRDWYDEHNSYNVNDENSGRKFSQLVWKNSKKIGIGHAYGGHKLHVIALYSPAGNIPGQFAANVGCGSRDRTNR